MDNAKRIADEALRHPAPEREDFIASACGADEALRARVESHLTNTADANPSAPTNLAPPMTDADATDEPVTIGPYRLHQPLGEGGFGTVYLASQEHPVRRRVALKVIKLGMDTKQVMVRFEAERQALAMMEHPGIARVFDAGATESGRPYFVMELVKGLPITEYCDRHKLSTRARLELLRDVCHAVQHAHQKGIIHRDLKPSNVLITVQDGHPAPKVIDFGIAKATTAPLTEHTLVTEYRQVIGTPEYMSPEQAEMSSIDIDTRSDIYSLGVLLYEILTGVTPFDSRALRAGSYAEMQRILRDQDPPRPSTRLSSLGEAGTRSAACRGASTVALQRTLRGDLDRIVMKAMNKDRVHRYDSATDLARDIARYLNDEPVEASPPGTAYRLRKLVRRHRGAVVATIALFTLLVLAVVGTGYGMLRAQGAEQAAADQRDEARLQADIANATVDFLRHDLLAAVAPSQEAGRGKDVLMRDVLDRAATNIENATRPGGRFADKPRVEARLRSTLGFTYRKLSLYDAAEPHLRRAADLCVGTFGEDDPETMAALARLGGLYWEQGRYADAEALLRRTLEQRRRVLGDDHPDTLTNRYDIGVILATRGTDTTEGIAVLTDVIAAFRQRGDMRRVTNAQSYLSQLYYRDKRLDEAIAMREEVVRIQHQHFGADDLDLMESRNRLAFLYGEVGRLDEAEQIHNDVLADRRRVLGADHHKTLWSMHNLARIYIEQGRTDDAVSMLRDTIDGRIKAIGPLHPNVADATQDLAILHATNGRPDDAEPLFLQTWDIRQQTLGESDHDTGTAAYNLGFLYEMMEREADAASWYVRAMGIRRETVGPTHSRTLDATRSACLLALATDPAAAALYAARALDDLEGTGSTPDERMVSFIDLLVRAHLQQDDPMTAATVLMTDVLPHRVEWGAAVYGGDGAMMTRWADALVTADQPEAAESLLQGWLAFMDATNAPPDSRARLAAAFRALYDAWGKPEAAARWVDGAEDPA